MKIDRSTEAGIDYLRGLFAIMVLVAHAIGTSQVKFPGNFESPGFALLTPGGFWVGGFFVLSGFCISLTVVRSFGRETYNPWNYLYQRFTRLAPIYWIGLGLAFGVWLLSDHGEFPTDRLLFNLFWIQNFFGEAFPYFGPSWSITNEVVYYLILPILIFFSGKKIERIAIAGILFYALTAIIVGLIWLFPANRVDWLLPFWTIPWNGVAWMFGVIALWVGGRLQTSGKLDLWKPRFLLLALAFLVVAYAIRTWCILTEQRAMISMAFMPLASIGFGLLLLGIPVIFRLADDFISSQARWFGNLSYPLYLFHMPLIGAILILWPKPETSAGVWILLAALIIIPLFVCGTIGVALERYFIERRKLWVKLFQKRMNSGLENSSKVGL